MKYYGRAPLRIGLGGGGSDIKEHFSIHGGAVVNLTINKYAHVFIEENSSNSILLRSFDLEIKEEYKSIEDCEKNISLSSLKLHIAAILVLKKKYNIDLSKISISTYVDAPPGSGLGSSSTLMVCIIGSILEFFKIRLDPKELALLAYSIEREFLGLKGGMQDQFSAAFGGCNLIQFNADSSINVNEIKLSKNFIKEFEYSFSLFDMGKSRDSSKIIDSQIKNMKKEKNVEDLNYLKEIAYKMEEFVRMENLAEIHNTILESWAKKKNLSSKISSDNIESILNFIQKNGGLSCKISGAGGGGFIFVGSKPEKKMHLIKKLKEHYNLIHRNFKIELEGFNGHFRKF